MQSIDPHRSTIQPEYDVIIVGGGPAGSTLATLLSQWGRRVLLLEKERFPRHHIGESLLAGTTMLMKQIGVYDKVAQAGFVHKYGATYIWGKSQEPWSIFFSEVGGPAVYSFQVERGRFDKILLDHSREAGVTVLEESRVTEFLRNGERIIGVTYLDRENIARRAYSHFCVDASGQSALLGTAGKQRRFNKTLRNFALYAYYQGGKSAVDLVPYLRSEDRGNIFIVAMEKGWVWYIPLGSDRYSVGVVTHADMANELSKDGRYQFYQNCLQSLPQMRYLLSEAQIESKDLYTQSDWSYICDSFKGPGYLLVGDAACFVDPILSTGVDLAMEGAFKAARAINTALTNPALTEQAMQWYEEDYKFKASHFLHMAEHWYYGHRSQDDWFWKAKSLVDPASNLSLRQAFILLTGGFTTGACEHDLPALQPVGGFRSFQLRTMYEHFDHAYNGDPSADTSTLADNNTVSQDDGGETLPTEFEAMQLRFKADISCQCSMIEQDRLLVPAIKIIQDVEGFPLVRLILPLAFQPLLEQLVGPQSVKDILEQYSLTSAATLYEREKLLALLQELYKNALVEAILPVAS